MMTVPQRYRVPIIAIVAVALVVLVGGAIALVAGSGPPASSSPPATVAPSATDPGATPASAVRAFFTAFAEAGRIDDPAVVAPFVTGPTSSAYLSAAGFLNGEKAVGKASVTTVLRLDNLHVIQSGNSASVSFDYVEGGYDIDPKTGQPLETPTILPMTKVVAVVKEIGGRWLVDSYQSQ